MREVVLDGDARRVLDDLLPALTAAFAGGEPVLPLPAGPQADPIRELVRPEPTAADLNGAAVVIPTSGSTGRPKGVLLPAAALRASAAVTHERLGGPGQWLLIMPATHVAGIQVLIRSLEAGRTPVVLDLTESFTAERFAAAAARTLAEPGPHYTALVPTQLQRILDAGGAATDALAAFAGVLAGAAPTTPTLAGRTRAAGVRLLPTYGMTETSGGCVYDGVPLAGADVALDADGGVTIAGPMLARGYLRDPDATAAAFRDGRFHTRDLGRWTDDGRLEILGRVDDVIVTGGEKVAPQLVERVLARDPAISAVCVVGVPDREWGEAVVAVVVAEGGSVDAGRLREAVRGELGRAAAPVRFVVAERLPLLGSGKVDRAALRRLVAS